MNWESEKIDEDRILQRIKSNEVQIASLQEKLKWTNQMNMEIVMRNQIKELTEDNESLRRSISDE